MSLTIPCPGAVALATRRGVHIFSNLSPSPHSPDEVAFIMVGVRCLSIRRIECGRETYAAAFHVGLGRWEGLAVNVSLDDAFHACGAFVDRVASIPPEYAPEHEAAEIAAARAVLVAFLPSAALPRPMPSMRRLAA